MRRFLLGFWSAALAIATAGAADLTVTVEGVRSTKGQVSFGLYGAHDPWPDGEPSWRTDRPAAASATYVFRNIPPGRYALSGFHDENANGLLDKNFFGLPKEGFLFSRDAKPRLAAPGFDACAVTLGDAPVSVTVHIQYWRSTE